MVLMSDYSYELKEESIARFPAHPRGSSKLVRVSGGCASNNTRTAPTSPAVSFHDNFADAFPKLAAGTHLVFNDSRVLDARLYLNPCPTNDDCGGGDRASTTTNENNGDNNKDKKHHDPNITELLECMILDLGHLDVDLPCNEVLLHCMIRSPTVADGQVYMEAATGVDQVRVERVGGIWQEDDVHSDGNGTECWIRIIPRNDDRVITVSQYLDKVGSVPLPPYVQRPVHDTDKEAYNNVYAKADGSVAAPTAGLHFTHQVLQACGCYCNDSGDTHHDVGRANDNASFLTLHVGAGTFKPVLVQHAHDHEMHAETFQVSVTQLQSIVNVLRSKKPLVVVGTTSCRTLESLYWCGVKALLLSQQLENNDGRTMNNSTVHDEPSSTGSGVVDVTNLILGQFEWKELQRQQQTATLSNTITRTDALQALIDQATTNASAGMAAAANVFRNDNTADDADSIISGRTSLMITPDSYVFQVVDHLVTNFHAPDSTLMLLVAAFLEDNSSSSNHGSGGDMIRSIYHEAQDRGYRFLSYGDVCFLSRPGCILPSDEDDNGGDNHG